MSDISDAARAVAFIADYANSDVAGKLNVIGANINILGQLPTGATVPFAMVTNILVPATFAGQQYVATTQLWDVTNDRIVQVPGGNGTLESLRAQQVVTVPQIQAGPGMVPPMDGFVTHTMVLNFSTGLPLASGTYEVLVQVDGAVVESCARFHVPTPYPTVIGGPAGPTDIPGVGPFPGQE